jgi:hypothetical protein
MPQTRGLLFTAVVAKKPGATMGIARLVRDEADRGPRVHQVMLARLLLR